MKALWGVFLGLHSQEPQGLKATFIFGAILRGAEAPLFHGAGAVVSFSSAVKVQSILDAHAAAEMFCVAEKANLRR